MAIESRLRHRVRISRRVAGATSGWGKQAVTFTDDATDTPALVQERSLAGSREISGPDLDQVALIDTQIFLPIGTVLTGRDRLTGVSPASIAGRVYQIIGEPRDAGGRGRHLELDAERLRA